ncbi:MAG: hypothetical protein IT304_03845 [Dehalococcoidia bacterium]|nr:hypothetical protein [Dehalococcoidia bacterium]
MAWSRPRRPRAAILGLPYFGRLLEGVLAERGWGARFYAHPGRDLRGWLRLLPALLRADLVYLISSRAERRSPQDLLVRLRRRRSVVVHWVGTDVLIAMDEWRRGRLSPAVAGRAVHWCDAPWLAEELVAAGIRAVHVPLPVTGLAREAPPLPARFRVLLYLPVDAFDREVFDMATLLRLPFELPDVSFTLIPSGSSTLPGPLPPNLEARDWVSDMDALYRETSVLVRLTSHDGTSFMVLEALSRGRHVIWTYPAPGVCQAAGFEAVAAALRDLYTAHAEGRLGLNEAGIQYARTEHDPERVAAALEARLRRLLAANGRRRSRGDRTSTAAD